VTGAPIVQHLGVTRRTLLRPADNELLRCLRRYGIRRAGQLERVLQAASVAGVGRQITDRDVDILCWIGRHGHVTTSQVARRWFRRDGNPNGGSSAAPRRLRILQTLGLIHRETEWFADRERLYRLAEDGATLAEARDKSAEPFRLGPARLVLAEIGHALALVDLTEQLLETQPGATITTERELRVLRRRELKAGTRKGGQGGRIPDAVLRRPGEDDVAIELDHTNKRAADYLRIIGEYKQESFKRIWWYVSELRAPMLRKIVAADRWAERRIEVGVW
jgi:Replication-relaxation